MVTNKGDGRPVCGLAIVCLSPIILNSIGGNPIRHPNSVQDGNVAVSGHIIPDNLMGDVWPVAQPGKSLSDYGSARLVPLEQVRIRSYQTIELVYTVGKFGLDDSGGIKVVQRFTNDGGPWQTTDPTAMNYVTATASRDVSLELEVELFGHQRPWNRSLTIVVSNGYMMAGDTITITFGDRTGGSPGLRMQTFCESAHEFRVLVDACATRHYMPLDERPALAVLPGPPVSWRAILPSLRSPGTEFALGLRADDLWGNPSDMVEGEFHLTAEGPIEHLPATVQFSKGQRALRVSGLRSIAPGIIRVTVTDAAGTQLAHSNPLVVREGPLQGYWGDLHGQSGESVGINPIREYFSFGRDLAMLDVMSHQANDFQVKNAFWDDINALTTELDTPGEFTAFPGYEWSGNTPTGGDHNVFFRREGRTIRRSSHALLLDRSDLDDDSNTTAELFEDLKDEDCVLFAHVGGRPADITQADGGHLRTAVELHSDWGTFEWIMADNFELGYRHGVVCNSDGHKGRPGASHPGAASFGALGGLTCFLTDELSRDGIFEAMRRRHHYGTTGGRLHLDVTARFARPAKIHERDPRLGETRYGWAEQAMMGDIVAVQEDELLVEVAAETQSPVLSAEILRGMEVVHTRRTYGAGELGNRFRVCFHGAEYRGRGRQTNWAGTARLSGDSVTRFETINAWNHDRLLELANPSLVEFDLLTTGNFVGFDIWLDDTGTLDISTGLIAATLNLSGLGLEPAVLDAGGLDRRITVTRLPDSLDLCSFKASAKVSLNPEGDTPVWVRVTTEDGHLAWSSPIYAFRE